MIRVIENSHRWTDLKQILTLLEFDEQFKNKSNIDDDGEYTVSLYKPLTIEYLLIGFKNTANDRTKLVFDGNYETLNKNISTLFSSVNDIIDYLERYVGESNPELEEWSISRFKGFIENTINCGFNLKPVKKMERQEIYKCLDTERDYQDLRWSPIRDKNNTPDEQKPPAEWINYIEYHLSKAKEQVYLLNDEDALAEVRKVAALAIRCLELHGCPERIIPADLLVKDA